MAVELFNLGAASGVGAFPSTQSTSQRPLSSLDSVQEDIYTRNLLFPDPQDLYEHRLNQLYPLSSGLPTPSGSSTNAFDYNGDIELDVRDVRIVVMQDALSSVAASLLYDSQAPPPVPTASGDRPSTTAGSSSHYSLQEARRTPASPRKPSISHVQRPIIIQPDSPKMRQGAFDRRPSVHGRGQAIAESDSQRTWREYREELATFSSCIFGNSELMAYKGTSTKVHVVPSESRSVENTSILGDGRGSVGRSSMRSSRLSQSFSSESVLPFTTSPTPGTASRAPDRKKVLVTRLFPVNLPTDEGAVSPTTQAAQSEDNNGYPFPHAADDAKAKKRKAQPKQKRTPMYAIALVINLPAMPHHSTPVLTSRAAFRGPSSYSEQDSFPSSFNSGRPSGWTLVGQGSAAFEPFETTFSNDIEDQIDSITQHWDIIMRTLSHLQSAVAATLLLMLKQADLSSPDPLPAVISSHMARTSSWSGRRGEDLPVKPPKTNAKHITLLPNCLLDNRRIAAEVDDAKTRIVAGIRAARVTTGQNRWPIWREEARRVAKWAGGREQGFFFFNLLTGFLATHTDWLQALSPPQYRRRHFLQQKGKTDEDAAVPARTIIVAHDKIAARRLVFLLAAFLPASQQLPGIRHHRPSTSASLGALSHSPPSFVVPILKEESLRRKINRRTGPRRSSHSRNLSLQSQSGRSSAIPPSLAHLSMEGGHERRVSDAASIRTTNLPMHGSDLTTRKSSAATTATMTFENSVPHFSTAHQLEPFPHGRPGSSNSIAANDLKRLTREDSMLHNVTSAEVRQGSNSRWGSVISGFWGTRRRDSASSGTKVQPLVDGQHPDSSPAPKTGTYPDPTNPSPTAIAGTELGEQPNDSPDSAGADYRASPEPPRLDPKTNLVFSQHAGSPPKVHRTPDPSGAFESPVKTSINDDGVIDVDVPFPDYITSFETAVSSPSSSGYLSAPGFGTGFEAFEQSCRLSVDGDVPLNVAGWLQQYHPDFVLQALPTQEDLMGQVKASMRAEPSPPLLPSAVVPEHSMERWMDISTAIVADTTTFTITRIRYRRLVKPTLTSVDRNLAPATPVNIYNSAGLTPALPPYEVPLNDEFIVEQVTSLDDVLAEAVEKVIAVNTDASKVSSSNSSRSTSKRRDRSNSTSTQSDVRSQVLALPHEVPRSQCKTVLLSALEEVIRGVIEEREQKDNNGVVKATVEREKESALREAVRGWLDSVELGD
ncbi:folliculin-interacting protein N-terminus-domain-containing protein [Lasiosphaeria miniovina]|uniref:Folliculin-interacting protein N-terminus-domain-containing protein n=1 Tax=Lasiosphaeria miniovina TaxID=1954250 RepID=A0AA40AUG7_9PEZI|nr:folliculin-interacting protein N-terminus-domain-containing protein [Lasiosphaeria miniovina]KAK0722186.1 folliculin-interacting protein N-terminus-domain-containing protein [Lasiosphaeria miniovina]